MSKENELKAKVNMFEHFFDKMASSMTEEQLKERDKMIDEYERIEQEEFAYNRFKNCGIGYDYWNCNFDTFITDSEEQHKMKELAIQFCDYVKNGTAKNLVITGNCGTGKTHIAAAILREFSGFVKERVYDQPVYSKIRYATVSDISDEFHDADSYSNGKSRTSIAASYKGYDILVIDEVGRLVNKFENESDLLFRIIDARYQAGKSTIMITNLSSKELYEMLNDATISRLRGFNRLMYFETKNISDYRENQSA